MIFFEDAGFDPLSSPPQAVINSEAGTQMRNDLRELLTVDEFCSYFRTAPPPFIGQRSVAHHFHPDTIDFLRMIDAA
ncbi:MULTISPECIES: hypothetical protein [Burkholderia]|uniref:hypothetical protein n=1 Tax=Burkholderia TaxID=32008 RepID=UPI001C2D1775|nr:MULTISPECIES: hypothetical protein [Burkholderia]MCU9953866.1 hypothetical protein [Burkholderia sp. BKH01]